MSEIKITETPIFRSKHVSHILPAGPASDTTNSILLRIENIEKNINDSSKRRVNHITHYFFDTSDTSRNKFDIIQSLGNAATELSVINSGGGFTIEINNEGYAIPAHKGLNFVDEYIETIWITGSGSTGTGQIRIGTWGEAYKT